MHFHDLQLCHTTNVFSCVFQFPWHEVSLSWFALMPRKPNNYTLEYLASASLNFCDVASAELKGLPKISVCSFCSLFGISPFAASDIYQKYLLLSQYCHPRFLLWALYFCWSYPTTLLSSLPFFCANPQTFSESVWDVLIFLSSHFDEVTKYFTFI